MRTLRIGEALALRRNCVDLLGRRIIVRESLSDANGQLSFQSPKTHQQRTLTLPRFLIDRLEKRLDQYVAADPRALLFVGATGEPDAAARLGHAAGTVTTRHYARPVLGETPRTRTDSTAQAAHGRRKLAGTKGTRRERDQGTG